MVEDFEKLKKYAKELAEKYDCIFELYVYSHLTKEVHLKLEM